MKQRTERRFALPVFAAVALAALAGSRVVPAGEAAPAPGTITTVAGTGANGFSGDGGPATQARLSMPFIVVVDAAGNLFIADTGNNRVRKVSPAGMISTVAGTGTAGFSGDGGLATQARLNFPIGLALDGAGSLFIVDSSNNRVRKVSPEGLITTVAGSGQQGFSGDGGPATEARFDRPGDIVVDAAGNLFISDPYNHRVRKVSPDGLITTVAGSGPTGADNGDSTGDGGLATEARLNGPDQIALDRSGNLFIAEGGNVFSARRGYRVRKVSAAGIITTVAGSDARGFSGDGGPATQAHLDSVGGVAVDTAGNLFIADLENYRVRKVDLDGIITTIAGIGNQPYAGDGGLATATGLRGPLGLTVDAAGNLLITDSGSLHSDFGPNERVLKVFGVAAPGLIAGKPFPIP
jgi:sugar lactone lactonase YvrE